MVQRLRFIGVAVLSILVLTIIGALSLSPAYAQTMTLNISPNPALPSQSVTFSGQVTPPATSADNIEIYVEPDNPNCFDDIRFVWLAVNLAPSTLTPSFPLPTFTVVADSAGHYSITATGGLPAGTYGVLARDTSYSSVEVLSACDPFNVLTSIPEYPLGVAILAIFMVIAYGVIRRKTIVKQK